MFIIGSAVFIVAFSFFKVTALLKTKNQNESWLKLISVFLVVFELKLLNCCSILTSLVVGSKIELHWVAFLRISAPLVSQIL